MVATKTNKKVRGHCLIWHNQNPGWLASYADTMSRTQLLQIMENHITNVVTHFKGKIREWDVVNEAIDTKQSDSLRVSFWRRKIGPEYLDSAFVYAHRADPDALLFYNDYNIEIQGWGEAEKAYKLVKRLKDKGIPIHGVGFQTHYILGSENFSLIDSNIKRYAALGLEVSITELDIRIKTSELTKSKYLQQAAEYSNFMRLFLNNSNCKSFVIWGFTDADSWIPSTFAGYDNALVFTAKLLPKPAYYALLDTMACTWKRRQGLTSDNANIDGIFVYADDGITPSTEINRNNGQLYVYSYAIPSIVKNKSIALSFSNLSGSATYFSNIIKAESNGTIKISGVLQNDASKTTEQIITLSSQYIDVDSVFIVGATNGDVVPIGSNVQLSIDVLPKNAAYKIVDWSVDSSSLATVSMSGLVTGKKDGWVYVKATAVDDQKASRKIRLQIGTVNKVNTLEYKCSIYPNPIINILYLNNMKGQHSIEVFSSSGKRVCYLKESGMETTVDCSNWNSGIYIVKVAGNTDVFQTKVIKE